MTEYIHRLVSIDILTAIAQLLMSSSEGCLCFAPRREILIRNLFGGMLKVGFYLGLMLLLLLLLLLELLCWMHERIYLSLALGKLRRVLLRTFLQIFLSNVVSDKRL